MALSSSFSSTSSSSAASTSAALSIATTVAALESESEAGAELGTHESTDFFFPVYRWFLPMYPYDPILIQLISIHALLRNILPTLSFIGVSPIQ